MRAMKDSGIPWIGEIPEGWEIVYGKKIYLANDGGVWGEDSDGIDDTIVLRPTEQDIEGRLIIEEPARRKLTNKEFESSKLKEGDLIITKSSGSPSHIGKTSLITESVAKLNCCYSNFIQRLRVNGNPLFYWFLLNSVVVKKQFEYLSTTTTGINNINSKTLDSLLFPIPSFDEQQRIAEFLDRKCAEVDEMIALQEQIIEELKAYKQSVITEAVTKGLNPATPMRDSGIEWIGQIPEHWEVRRIGSLFRLRDEKNYKPMGEVQLLSLYTGIGVFPHGEQEERGNKAVTTEGYKIVRKNDVVVNIILAWMGAIGVSNYDGVTSPAYDVYIPNHNAAPHYYHYVFRTKGIAAECYKYGRGIMMMRWRTYSSEFKQIHIPYPNIAEQQAIADYLDEKCADIDSLIQTKQSKIDSLKEYKKSIIYEYVTGKREVNE